MQVPQNPAAFESSGTLTTPSGYTTPNNESDVEKQTPIASLICIGRGKPVPAVLEEEDYIVDFEGPNDPRNPQNWSTWKKYACVYPSQADKD